MAFVLLRCCWNGEFPSFTTVVYGIIVLWFLNRSALIYGGPGHSVILIAVAHRRNKCNLIWAVQRIALYLFFARLKYLISWKREGRSRENPRSERWQTTQYFTQEIREFLIWRKSASSLHLTSHLLPVKHYILFYLYIICRTRVCLLLLCLGHLLF